jgi:hypothetical protein
MLCVLCDEVGVGGHHYARIHGFRLTDHYLVTSATATKPTSYICRACRPERVKEFSPGDAVLHFHTTHRHLVDDLPVEREVPEPEPELPVLTWELFDQWAGRYVALQEERDELVVEITSLKSRVEDLTRAVEEQHGKLNDLTTDAVSNEFFKVYEDIRNR